MIDMDAVTSFAVFAEKRNFTHAAKLLNISQPALHVKIRKLAEFIGVALYTRKGSTLTITSAGLELTRFARAAQADADALLARIRGEQVTDTLIIAAGEGALLYLLGDAIQRFGRVRILNRNREGTIDAIRTGEAHAGVTTLDSIPTGLAVTELVNSRQVVVMPARHRLARRKEIAPSDLESESLIVPPSGRPHRDAISRLLLDAGVSWNIAAEAEGWPVMIELARRKLGLAIVNDICTLPAGVVARPLRGMPATRYYIVQPKGARSEAARTFVTLLRARSRGSAR